jgi:hypothetical protein
VTKYELEYYEFGNPNRYLQIIEVEENQTVADILNAFYDKHDHHKIISVQIRRIRDEY